jgi:hypothetical protein
MGSLCLCTTRQVSLVLLIPLPPVSAIPAAMTPVAMTPVANCHRYQRHRWQTMGLISGCRYFKVNLKAKMYIDVKSTIQRCPNKIVKIFLIEDFFHLPPVSTTPVGNLELQIFPWIFDKIRNGPTCILRGLGETDSWNKPEPKNLLTLSL